jgi:putative hydrolase of the HAD superfamily
MPSASHLDGVTVDAFGTLVELESPVLALRQALAERGVERDDATVAAAFAAEAEYYRVHNVEGGDEESLRRLRRECAAVFLRSAAADLDPEEFTGPFVGALVFRPVNGAVAALERLRAAGLALACVSDWDVSVGEQLERAALRSFFAVVVSSAETGAEKPDPAVFAAALGQLGIRTERALHIGDTEADREGAAAAGLAFEPAPLATLPARLGLR